MAAGLPIIASKFDEWENLLSPFNCCLFVDPKNTDEIAEAMLWYWRILPRREKWEQGAELLQKNILIGQQNQKN